MKLVPKKQQWELAFEDWEILLDRADAKNLLQDPKAVWDEAWRQAVMLSTQIVSANVEADVAMKLSTQLERKMLR